MIDQRQTNLLRRLLSANGGPISQLALAEDAGINPQDLQPLLASLEADGFAFDRIGTGLRLVAEPDAIRPQSVLARLETESIGRRIYVFRETGSTNDLARRAGLGGEEEGVTFFAERQTAGRGTQGRNWVSGANQGLWCSILLHSQLPLDRLPVLVQMAALAAAEAAERWVDQAIAIKPPNDLMLAGGKVAGFLLETSNAWQFQVLGIGINVRSAPEIEGYPTAALEQFSSGGSIPLADLAAQLLNRFEEWYLRMPPEFLDQAFAKRTANLTSMEIAHPRTEGNCLSASDSRHSGLKQ